MSLAHDLIDAALAADLTKNESLLLTCKYSFPVLQSWSHRGYALPRITRFLDLQSVITHLCFYILFLICF
jgi:hypothetical protein